MRNAHLQHEPGEPFYALTNAQIDKYVVSLMLLFDQPGTGSIFKVIESVSSHTAWSVC